MQLTRKRVITTAIELIERDGAEAVSMRALATELGCGLMSLYNHVPSKNALLDAVAAHVMCGVRATVAPDASWADQLRAEALALCQIARAYPRCTVVALSRPPRSAAVVQPIEDALAALGAAGFAGLDAVRIIRAFVAYIAGSLLLEAGPPPGRTAADDLPDDDGYADGRAARPRPEHFPQVTTLTGGLAGANSDADFEFGLDLLMHAVAALRLVRAAS
jgi:AcrR family transcriptional regulator